MHNGWLLLNWVYINMGERTVERKALIVGVDGELPRFVSIGSLLSYRPYHSFRMSWSRRAFGSRCQPSIGGLQLNAAPGPN